LLVSKEIKAGKTHVKEELSDEKKKKIKTFVKDYMDKVMARKTQKQASKQQDSEQHDSGPPQSVSTETSQRRGSSPRDVSQEAELDEIRGDIFVDEGLDEVC
jgi:SRI (Set2 Rpb1 interacting) domain